MLNKLFFTFLISVLFLSGCADTVNRLTYKIDIPQGNIIKEGALAQIHPGMPKEQVIFTLGSPLLQDPFHTDRWDYYYNPGVPGQTNPITHFSVYFKGNLVSTIVSHSGETTIPNPSHS